MDTRWRKLKYSKPAKIVCWVLCFISMVIMGIFALFSAMHDDVTMSRDFLKSSYFKSVAGYYAANAFDDFQRESKDAVRSAAYYAAGAFDEVDVLRSMSSKNVEYYIQQGEVVYTNLIARAQIDVIKASFMERPFYILYDKNAQQYEGIGGRYGWRLNKAFAWADETGGSMYISVKTPLVEGDYLYQAQKEYQVFQWFARGWHSILAGAFVTFILTLIYLFRSLKKKTDEGIRFRFWDKIYIEVKLLLYILILAVSFNLALDINLGLVGWYIGPSLMIAFLILFNFLPVTFIIISINKYARSTKIADNSMCYKVYTFGKRIFDTRPVRYKAIILFLAYVFVHFFLILIMFIIQRPTPAILIILILLGINAYAIYFLGLKSILFGEIVKGAQIIAEGNLDFKLQETGGMELSCMALSINQIGEGMKVLVDEAVKNERFKSELITNVSHDLKTPLTSIINYVELMKNEELSETLTGYVDVLEKKSQRLKVLVEDLFEAAKAASGCVQVASEKIEPEAIVNQALAEFEEKIQQSALNIRLNASHEKVFVQADGRLLWRVLDNLISNIVKYSLAGSRVYIDMVPDEKWVHITLKNISAEEMNFKADEIVERFKRGDESRNTEGSGLGLSIAKSLTELQNGRFFIEIDGDLFKVTVSMRRYG